MGKMICGTSGMNLHLGVAPIDPESRTLVWSHFKRERRLKQTSKRRLT